MSQFRTPALLILICAAVDLAAGETRPVELKWNEIAPLVAGRNVDVTLAEGGRVRGEAIAVRENTLVVDVRGSSGAGSRFQNGNADIPRPSIVLIRVDRTRGAWGRTMGTVLGVLSGMVLGGWAAAHTDSASAGIPTFLGIASGVSVTGYYAGRALDKRSMLIRIVP
jgi:hypothetical protein